MADSNTLDSLTSDLQNYIVSPLNAFGLGGFVFDVQGENTTTLTADITDHYAEDNKAFQDHIARKPKSITLRGYVGEIVYDDTNNTASNIIQQVTEKLTTIASFLPVISASTMQIQNALASTDSISGLQNLSLSDAADLYGMVKNAISGLGGDTPRQQAAYLYFKACWEQGILMGIQTPWEFLTNMAIESVVAIETEGTKYMTDFAVKYKQFRFAQTSSSSYNQNNSTGTNSNTSSNTTGSTDYSTPPQLDGSASVQGSDPVNIGNVSGAALPSANLPTQLSTITDISALSPQANNAALSAYRAANGLATPPVDIQLGLTNIFTRP